MKTAIPGRKFIRKDSRGRKKNSARLKIMPARIRESDILSGINPVFKSV